MTVLWARRDGWWDVGLAGAAVLAVVGLGWDWPMTADQLVYAQQAAQGEFMTRTVHLGWLALLAVGGSGLALVMQALGAGVVVWGAGRLASGPVDRVAQVVALAALLPMAGVLEVDVLWTALVVLAALDRHELRSTLWLALALLVSPTALLAVPWLLLRRSGASPSPVVSALGLWLGVVTVVGGLDWLMGERGLLAVPSWRLRPVLLAWVERSPWLFGLGGLALAGPRGSRVMLGALPLLLAPADVPVQWLAAVIVLSERPRVLAPRPLWVLATLQLVVFGVVTAEQRHEAERQALVLDATSRQWQHGDVALAPWRIGVVVSTEVSGTAYGVPWRSEGRLLPRQEARWCAATPLRVHLWRNDRFELREPTDPEVVDWLGCRPPR